MGLVALDGVEEGVVVGSALGGDLPQKKMDVAGRGDDRPFGGVLGRVAGVIALDGSAGRRDCGCGGRKMQGHVGFDFEGRAQFNGRRGSTCGGLCGQIGQAKLGKRSGDAYRFLRPIDEFRLGDFVIDGEGLFRRVRVGGVHASHLPAEPVGQREKLGEVPPFLFGRLVKGDAEEKFVIAAQGVVNFGDESAASVKEGVNTSKLN